MSFNESIREAAAAAGHGVSAEQAKQMEQLGLYLDELEKKDPEQYKSMMTKLAASMGASAGASGAQGAAGMAALAAAMGGGANPARDGVRLPGKGGKVLGKEGVAKSRTAVKAITVTPKPGFVIKTKSGSGVEAKKVFINVVTSESIKAMSM